MLDPLVRVIEQSGHWVYVLAPLFMIVVAILPIPAEIPAMVNGMVFGALAGSLVTWGGAVVGALISFELARRYGRPLTERLLRAPTVRGIDGAALAAGWPGLLAIRLVPTIAFTLVNWAAGLTAIPRWRFAWTTALGIMPGAVVFTVTGAGLGTLYRRAPVVGGALIALAVVVIVWPVVRSRRKVITKP